MPTDPPAANQTNASVPHGQAIPNAQHLPQQPHARIPQQPQHLRYPQHPQQLLQQPSGIPLPHHNQPQHLVQRQQYAALSSARNISQMQQPHLAQPPHQLQQPQPPQQQPRQHPRPALTHQQQPPQQQYYVNGGYHGLNAYPQVPAQYGLNPNYVFPPQGPFPYNGMQPQPGPQQPPPQNPRAQRPYPRNPPSQLPQRQPRVTLPAPKKHILAIVDPDTNEEVKVDTVDTKPPSRSAPIASPSTTVKIPTRTSRPLELVSDPADSAPKPEPASKAPKASESVKIESSEAAKDIGGISEDKEKPVVVSQAPVSAKSSDTSVTIAEKATAKDLKPEITPAKTSQALDASETLAVERATTNGVPAVPVPDEPKKVDIPISGVPLDTGTQVDVEAEDEAPPTAPTSENAPATSDSTTMSESVVVPGKDSDKIPATDSDEATIAREEVGEAKVLHGSDASANGTVSSTAAPPTAADVPVTTQESESPEAPALGKKEVSSSTVTSVDTDSNPQPTPRRERPVFKEGDRRVYTPDFMLSMRSSADPKRVAEYEVALSSNNIFKIQRSRPVRASAGPLSTDPRGKRAFPAQAGPGYMVPARGGAPGMVGSGVGSYDAFDLRSARSQNPPPAPKGQSNHVRGSQDPRGSRGRFDGPTRGGHGPLDPFVDHHVEKLKRSEKGWKRDKESDDEITSKVKQIRSLLNKLTLEKFDKIFKQIIDIDISSYEILAGVVKEVFEKALFEPKFSGMYAELCVRLDVATREMLEKANVMDSKGKPIFFKNILLNNCRDEFTRFAVASEAPAKKPEDAAEAKEEKKETTGDDSGKEEGKKEEKMLTPDEKKEKERLEKEEADTTAAKAKRRMLANVRFIGELFLKNLLREQIIHKQCIQRLLTIGIEKREEDVLEALCKLLSKTGAKLSQNKDAIQHIDNYFKPLELMSRDHTLPARVRFMLQDLIEQRANGWKVRREEVGAKTIAEIHKDIEKEERAKAEAQAAARERRGRGGSGMHQRERGQQNFPPRVPMTMASRQKVGSGVSRSTMMLLKHASRGSSNAPSSLQSVHLGPGGSKSSSVSSASGGTLLRPGGSRYGSFSALSDPRESSTATQSGDARRATTKKQWQSAPRRSVTGKPEPAEVKPKLMDPDTLKRRTKGIVLEYWSVSLLDEVKELVEQEVLTPNYAKFVEEAVKVSLSGKVEHRDKSIPLFVGLIEETIPGADFVTAFSAVIAELSDIEVDDPRASEFLGKYIGATAASGNLNAKESSVFGLDFLKGALTEISDPKRATKLVAHIFASLYKNLIKSIPDEVQRKVVVKRAMWTLDLDLASRMNTWNPIRGTAALETMLMDLGIVFALPLLPVELRLKEALMGPVPKEEVTKVFSSCKLPDEELRSEAFMKMVIRVSFDWLFMDPPISLKDVFCNVVRNPLVQCFGGEIPRDVQMAALLETQSFIVKNLDILPAHREGEYDKPGSIAFDCLYFADIVEEDTFLGWKEDTDKSIKIGGKDKMIIQTSPFFRWLATAEEE